MRNKHYAFGKVKKITLCLWKIVSADSNYHTPQPKKYTHHHEGEIQC